MNYLLSQNGAVLATRPRGREVKEAIEREWLSGKESVLILDFASLMALSPSAADELVGRLYSDLANGDYGDRQIVLDNVNEDHEEILIPILRRRAVLAPRRTRKGVELLGAPSHLQETYQLANKLKEFRAAEIAAKAGLTVPAANNRLTKLLRSHVLRRTEKSAAHGGREYVYTSLK